MGKVYRNSTVTIAAASANGTSEGFLSARKLPEACTLPFLTPDGVLGSISLAAPIYTYNPAQPLDSRGWALQEFLLSPRLLMYGASELTWHCQTESYKPVTSTHLYYWQRVKRLPPEVFNHRKPRLRSCRQQIEVWASIISEYTRRSLTYTEDKLPAIDGIASELKEVWQDEYIYGMWRKCLVPHLGWQRPYYFREPNLSRSDRAPSWSWASMNCPVEWDSTIVHYPEANVENIVDDFISSTAKEWVPRELSITGKVLISEAVEPEHTRYWFARSDLDGTDMNDGRIFYLLLGRSKRKHPVGLILIQLDTGVFRRIGCLDYCDAVEWSDAHVQTINIV